MVEHAEQVEVAFEYEDILGTKFASDLQNLKDAYFGIRLEWRFYKSLFGSGSERVELLNNCSSLFFYSVQRTLSESVILGLCRLLDPIQTGSKKNPHRNMTFRRLLEHLEGYDFQPEFEKLLMDADAKSVFAKEWRNKHIAHSDYDVATGAVELESATVDSIQDLIDAIGRLISIIHSKCLSDNILLDAIAPLDNEMRLLRTVYEGVEAEKKRNEDNNKAIDRGDYKAYVNCSYPDWLTGQGGN